MPEQDLYKVLGVSRTATADDIKKAHRKLSRKYHPDVKPDDKEATEKFKEIQNAFDVLGDPDKRAQYDRFGTTFREGAGPGPQGHPGGNPFAGGNPFGGGQVDLNDILGGQFDFGDLFGGGAGRGAAGGSRTARPRRGSDAQLQVEIPFQTAVEGGTHDLHLDRDGKPELIKIKVPAGVDTGSVIRLAGQGQPGRNQGPAGDLLVTLQVRPHPIFRRDGANLLFDLPLSVAEATLGAKVEVPTLTEGKVMLTIPPGTSSGAKLRLRGKGGTDIKTQKRGDLFAVIKVIVPQKLSAKGEELMKQFAEAVPQSPRQGLW